MCVCVLDGMKCNNVRQTDIMKQVIQLIARTLRGRNKHNVAMKYSVG